MKQFYLTNGWRSVAPYRRALILFLIVISSAVSSMAQTPLDETEVYNKLIGRKNVEGYKEGTPWDNSHEYKNSVYFFDIPPGRFTGKGCYGFMMDMMEYASNYEYPIRKIEGSYDNLPEIHVGDGVRLDNNGHSVVVLEKNGSVVTVAEANFNSSVHWGRTIDLSKASNGFTFIATFWPESSVTTGITENDVAGLRDIRIFNTKGSQLKSLCQTSVTVRSVLDELPQGIYIVKEGSKTYKVFNKK